MSRTIHGLSHKGMKHFRKQPATLAVYWIYVSRMNNEGVAWPSLDRILEDVEWSKKSCLAARHLLVELKAIERVENYIRPDWRKLEPAKLKHKLDFDRSEYYRPTGYIVVDDKKIMMLYNGADEISAVDQKGEEGADKDDNLDGNIDDSASGEPSLLGTITGVDGVQNAPELDSTSELDSTRTKHKDSLPDGNLPQSISENEIVEEKAVPEKAEPEVELKSPPAEQPAIQPSAIQEKDTQPTFLPVVAQAESQPPQNSNSDYTNGAGDKKKKMTERRQQVEIEIFTAIGLKPESTVESVWVKVRQLSKWLESLEVKRNEFLWFVQQIRDSKKLPEGVSIYITLFLDGTNQSKFKDYLLTQRKRNAEVEEGSRLRQEQMKNMPKPDPQPEPVAKTAEEIKALADEMSARFAREKAERNKKPEVTPLWQLLRDAGVSSQ